MTTKQALLSRARALELEAKRHRAEAQRIRKVIRCLESEGVTHPAVVHTIVNELPREEWPDSVREHMESLS